MNPAIVVQARMSSSRLPGKVMRQAGGKPLLDYVITRLQKSKKCRDLIVATSTDPSDDLISEYCLKKGIFCHRGPLEDVAGRFLEVILAQSLSAFVRISADSPWIDWQIVDLAVETFQKTGAQIVTTTFNRTFPRGQSVEVVDAKLFEQTYPKMSSKDEWEHVTRIFYKYPERFKIHPLHADSDHSAVNLCVDTSHDFELFTEAVAQLGSRAGEESWQKIVQVYEEIKNKNLQKSGKL